MKTKPLTFLLALTFLFLFSCSVYDQEEVKENVKRLKVTNSCTKCNLVGADLDGANLNGADLTGAKMKNIKNLDSAIKCKTIFSWGEENSGC